MGEEARQLSRRRQFNAETWGRASDAVELAALADASRFLSQLWGALGAGQHRYCDVALGAGGGVELS